MERRDAARKAFDNITNGVSRLNIRANETQKVIKTHDKTEKKKGVTQIKPLEAKVTRRVGGLNIKANEKQKPNKAHRNIGQKQGTKSTKESDNKKKEFEIKDSKIKKTVAQLEDLETTVVLIRQVFPKTAGLTSEDLDLIDKLTKDAKDLGQVLSRKVQEVFIQKAKCRTMNASSEETGKSTRTHVVTRRTTAQATKRDELKKQYDTMNRSNTKLFEKRESGIQGKGAFAKRVISKGEMIAEYKGERIDIYECDAREVIYNRDKIPNYFFAITGTKIIVDATKHGNDSKFINHSCDPNTEVEVKEIDGKKLLIFYAKRTIEKDEELTFDYKFEKERIECLCGAAICRKYLN